MIRKLVTIATAVTVMVGGLLAPTAANAVAPFSPSVTVPNNAAVGSVIPLNDDASLLVWVDGDDNGRYVRSGLLHKDGTFDSQATIFQGSTATRIHDNRGISWTILPDGTVAYVWAHDVNNFGNHTSDSYLNVVYTQDGKEWSAPIQVLAPINSTDSDFMCMMEGCGYSDPRIANDINGIMAISVRTGGYNSSQVVVTTSLDGVNWNSGSQLYSGQVSQNSVLSALPAGGFMLLWQYHDGNNWNLQYSTSGKISYWTRAKTVSVGVIERAPVLGQTSPTDLSMFTVTADNVIPIVHQQVFNFVTKTWGTRTDILTMPTGWTSGEPVFSLGKNWHSAIAFADTGNGTNTGNASLVELKNSVPQLPKTLATSTTEPSMNVAAIRVNFDDSITAIIRGSNEPVRIIKVKDGSVVSTEIAPLNATSNIWALNAAVSKSGNFFFVTGNNTGTYEGMTYVAATAPLASGILKVSGTAKKGKQLVAALPTFTSVSDLGTTTVQWYRCSAKVAVARTTVPAGCLPIAKATTAKFKVTAKEKNKFLAVAVSNTNALGTSLVFSPTTAKAK